MLKFNEKNKVFNCLNAKVNYDAINILIKNKNNEISPKIIIIKYPTK